MMLGETRGGVKQTLGCCCQSSVTVLQYQVGATSLLFAGFYFMDLLVLGMKLLLEDLADRALG